MIGLLNFWEWDNLMQYPFRSLLGYRADSQVCIPDGMQFLHDSWRLFIKFDQNVGVTDDHADCLGHAC